MNDEEYVNVCDEEYVNVCDEEYVNVCVVFKQTVNLQYKVTSPTSHYRENIIKDAVDKMKKKNNYIANSKVNISISEPFCPDDF